MRWRIGVVRAVALVLLAVLVVIGLAGYSVIGFVMARFDPVDFFIIGIGVLWPVLLLAGVAFAAWLAWTRSREAEGQLVDKTGSDFVALGCLALVLAPLVVMLVGAVAMNWRVVSCSMADRSACPDVAYQDIRLDKFDDIAEPYSMDFREPVWPEGLVPTGPEAFIPTGQVFFGYGERKHPADWLMLYKTWGDGEFWAACRRRSTNPAVIACKLFEAVDEYTPNSAVPRRAGFST
jgi:hypothetical protein